MYAWRARVGLIKPTHRGKGFHFWYKRAPDGVEIVPTFVGFRRSDRQTFENAFERIEAIADDNLQAVGCNIIAVSGTPPVLLKGLDFEREWGDRLSQKIGLPVVTQMEPHALALMALGVKRVAIATYYGDELNDAIVRYFGRLISRESSWAGFTSLAGRKPSTRPHCEPWTKCPICRSINTVRAATRRSSSRSMPSTSTAAAGTRRRRMDLLQNETSVPRWSSRLLRKCGPPYRRLAIEFSLPDCGALLRDSLALPPRP